MEDLLTLEAHIGGPHWINNYKDNDPPEYVKNALTVDLREWVRLNGMPEEKVNNLLRPQLERCYCIRNYFDAVMGNRPKNLAQTRRDAQRFRDSLDVENILKDPGKLVEKDFGYKKAPPPSPLDFRPQDPVRELLSTVEQTINQRISSLRDELDRKTVDAVTKIITETQPVIFENVKSSLEDGTIDITISKELEKKILSLVQRTTDEVVFQALRNNTHRKESEPELDFGNECPPSFPDQSHSKRGQDGQDSNSHSFIPHIDHKFYFDPFASRVTRKALGSGRHVYLHGPAGCGKTMLIEQVCALVSHGLFRINPHDGITREFFLGGIKLKAGETYFQDGALPIAMRQGLALLVDEFSFLPPNLAAILHPVLERNGKLFIPETGEVLHPASGFCVLATDNTGGKGDALGQFTGTEVQNTATLDRFDYSVVMDYLPRVKEEEMLLERFNSFIETDSLEHSELDKLLSLAEEVRKAFTRGELAITLSTRKLIAYFEQRQQGFSLSEALSLSLLSWLDDDDRELVKVMLDRLNIKVKE